MANIWAIKSGNWSDPTVWNTGSLPTSVDDVSANNFNITVDQSIEIKSLRNQANTDIVLGGNFDFNTPDITIVILDKLYATDAKNIIKVTANTGTITFNHPNNPISTDLPGFNTIIFHTGNCTFIVNTISLTLFNYPFNGRILIDKNGNGHLIVNANVNGPSSTGAGNSRCIYSTNVGGSITINGNITGGSPANMPNYAVFINLGSVNLTVNGNIIGGGSAMGGGGTVTFSSVGALNVTGNVTGNISKAIYATAGTINITGPVSGSVSQGVPAVDIAGSASLNHVGAAQASAYSSAIICNSPISSIVTATGPFLRNGYIVAIASQTLRINFNSNSYFQFKKLDGDDIDYVSTIEGYNYPTATDVRDGVVYKSGLVTGTLKVPNPADVRKSIPTDNTVGTADITPEDFITALENSTSDIAVRLRNCATVESTGAQIASYE